MTLHSFDRGSDRRLGRLTDAAVVDDHERGAGLGDLLAEAR